MATKRTSARWLIGGEAGFGIMSAGALLAKTCVRSGLWVFDDVEYPSLIRGGHNAYRALIDSRQRHAHDSMLDVLVALNLETITLHLQEVVTDGVIVYDVSDDTFVDWIPPKDGRRWIPLPMEDLARKAGGQKLLRNTVAIGASLALLGLPEAYAEPVLQDEYGAKGGDIVALNVALVRAGYTAITVEDLHHSPIALAPSGKRGRYFFTGNEALSIGALVAGVQYFSAYPMTPATSILMYLAEHGPENGMVVRHAEDEIAVINGTIGAAYAGVRALCATSGGGFALMTEAVGLAAIAEVGMVIINAQRGGPSTGLPTWTEQGDLQQVLHAGQGDLFRIVLAPSSVQECITLLHHAFVLADRYQTPVILLTDKLLAEAHQTIDRLPTLTPVVRDQLAAPVDDGQLFPRYQTDTPTGISPRTIPGIAGGQFLANSDEHDAVGHTNEERQNRIQQVEKRLRKEATAMVELPRQPRYGTSGAPCLIITWGSTRGAVVEAMELVRADHISVEVLVLTHLWPFPKTEVTEAMSNHRRTIIVELNQSGQLAQLLRQETGLSADHQIRKSDGRPFDPEEIAQHIRTVMK
jgi:2-oxoglutarate ferredoxin oxidoreductase subunit alpha